MGGEGKDPGVPVEKDVLIERLYEERERLIAEVRGLKQFTYERTREYELYREVVTKEKVASILRRMEEAQARRKTDTPVPKIEIAVRKITMPGGE